METYVEQRYKMLSEQYYGTNKYLDNIDRAFQKILDNKGTFSIAPTPEFLSKIRPYLNEIEKNFEELFNFKKVNLNILGDGTYNAFTLTNVSDPLIFEQNMDEKELGPYGIRYKNKVRNVIIRFNYEMFFHPKITNRILTAIILHEVGHNFYVESTIVVIAKKVDMVHKIKTAFEKDKDPRALLLGLSYIMVHTRSFSDFLETSLRKFGNSELGKIINYMASLRNSIASLQSLITFYTVKWNKNLRYLKTHEKIAKKVLGLTTLHGITLYRNELFADNFATTYGYGPEILEMSAVFASMHTGNHIVDSIADKSKIFAALNDFLLHYDKFILDVFTTRADSYSRMLDQISYLEKNIENCENQANKKQMLAELDRCKKTLSKFNDSFDIMADGSVYKNGQIMTGINLSLFKLTKGGISYNVRKYEGAASRKGQWKNLL